MSKQKPQDGTVYAMQELLKRERFVGQVYLPGNKGDGMEAIALQNGNSLFMTSCNFLEYECRISNIICEPHKSVVTPWAHRAIELAFNKIAFLLPMSFVATEEAKVLFDKTPLVRLYVLTRHLPFRRGASAWLVWEKGDLEASKVRWI